MGPFNSLNEILEVDGFSEKLLDKICKRIIFNNENNTSDFIPKLKEKIKRPKQLIIPYHDNKFVSEKLVIQPCFDFIYINIL